MKKKKLLLIFALHLTCLNAQTQESTTLSQRVDQYIKPFMEKYKVPGAAVILYVDGKPYQFQYGYADRDAKKPVTEQTLFELGSISKIFTVLLLAQEIQEGHMHLEDPISLYIPELQSNKALKAMTLEKLATHTADLPFNAPDEIKNTQELIEHIKKWKPVHKEPVWWKYSNHGIELIRIALERYTGKPYNELLITRILKPLGMSAIGVTVPEQFKKQYACCYDKLGNKSITWNHEYLIGSAAIKVSSKDMQQFLKVAIGLPFPTISMGDAMRMTQLPYVVVDSISHGLAWEISHPKDIPIQKFFDWPVGTAGDIIYEKYRVFDPHALYEKGGTTHGFHAFIAVIPGKKSGIAIMINKRRYNGWKVLKKLGRDILLKEIEYE